MSAKYLHIYDLCWYSKQCFWVLLSCLLYRQGNRSLEYILIANKYMKRCSTSLVMRERHLTTLDTPIYRSEWLKLERLQCTECWEGCGETGTPIHGYQSVNRQMCKAAWQHPFKLSMCVCYDPEILVPRIHPMEMCSKGLVWEHVHSNIITKTE